MSFLIVLKYSAFGVTWRFDHVVLDTLDDILQLLDICERVLTARVKLLLPESMYARAPPTLEFARAFTFCVCVRSAPRDSLVDVMNFVYSWRMMPRVTAEVLDLIKLCLEIIDHTASVLR